MGLELLSADQTDKGLAVTFGTDGESSDLVGTPTRWPGWRGRCSRWRRSGS